ncbi:hypothetical protein NIZ24_23380 (plasmid) [Escherichia albertii]|uniref:hypothetical protein n=1 Tax=Escherichia albertii TaxID=208962 RepID=UPI002119EEE1|nr:hypothetical protein [Escherichia albertii]UUK76282.1 hypothetical protein NIZ24_23380 [Escherichia albertii]WDB63228.1 hypothetical protein PS053_22965 [Escherichia albertii]WDB72214.1 hypothetical protein PS045_22980 [Escherichia albertii]WDB76679.1 hypothetical protein PS034_23990 [Escherichia albertii]WDB81428.1 hypothetical protein PS039_24180 [Escherichia albertii]
MIFVCSVVLAGRTLSLHLAGKLLPLSEDDVLLIDDSDRDDFLPHTAYITDVRVDEHTVHRYLESYAGMYSVDTSASPEYLRVSFAHSALLRDVMHHLNSGNFVHPAFSEQMFFPVLLYLHQKRDFFRYCREACCR